MAHFRDLLPLHAWPGYFLWHYRQRKPFECSLRGGPNLSIRPLPSRDYDTVFEIFFDRIYDRGLNVSSVRRIVDLGGNVGYSCLYWCVTYPHAEVVTFEPHPVHCRLLQRHLEANGYAERVHVFAAAAGVRDGIARLTDRDDASAIVPDAPSSSLEVRIVDIFPAIADGPIDILKMDIEGSEYPILEDSRFDALAARTRQVLLEWHTRGEYGEAFCRKRLAGLGFAVASGRACGTQYGMLYGTRGE